jgi:hypothetical protein
MWTKVYQGADMSEFQEVAGLKVANELFDFVENEALKGLGEPDFWGG